MHVLPLPFGLALALIPRREADKIRAREEMREEIRPILRNAIRPSRAVSRRRPLALPAGSRLAMRSETFYTPGDVRLNLELPAGKIEVESTETDDTHVELEAVSDNEQVREMVETARIEEVRRGDGTEVVVEVRTRHGVWISFSSGARPPDRHSRDAPAGALPKGRRARHSHEVR